MYMLSHVYCIQTGCSASASDYTLDTVEGTEEVLDSSVLACFSLSLSLYSGSLQDLNLWVYLVGTWRLVAPTGSSLPLAHAKR